MWNRISMFGQLINKIGKITNFGLKEVKGFGSILTTTLTLF